MTANDPASFGDARLEELKLLTQLAQMDSVRMVRQQGPMLDMVAYLVRERLVSDMSFQWFHTPVTAAISVSPGKSALEQQMRQEYIETLSKVLGGQEIYLRISHKGRVRLSELKQQLTGGKIREPFGILWDGRHFDNDLQVALVDAHPQAPLSLVCLDMNGVKAINDQWGHSAGDSCLRAYFQAVAAAIADKGNAYRVGGDEVFAILPTFDGAAAKTLLETACSLIMKEKVRITEDQHVPLAVSVGIATTTDPGTEFKSFRAIADKEMYRAKASAENAGNSCSGIAVSGEKEVLLVKQP